MKVTCAFNIRPDGTVVLDGPHSPGTSFYTWDYLGITCSRISEGKYEINGNEISWPEGWKITIFLDENMSPTSFVKLSSTQDSLVVESFDPESRSIHKDITHLMTIRVMVEA
ncbi:hypothetical protein CUB19_gp20 [Stenotrophomonas phage CUB19]|nr:hypothetical protein CUB19_gp20 [Stenotrophomonas phage CUB19]